MTLVAGAKNILKHRTAQQSASLRGCFGDRRTGTLPAAFQSDFGFETFVDYALDTPMMFVIR